MKRLIVVALLLVSPAAVAAPYALPDEYLLVAGTDSGASVAGAGTGAALVMSTPAPPAAEPAKRFPRYGYFFLAYAIVWGGLAAYVAFLATRIAGIEARLPRRP